LVTCRFKARDKRIAGTVIVRRAGITDREHGNAHRYEFARFINSAG
jgi:hypothetical protein